MINIYPTGEDVEVSGSYPFAMSVQLKSTSLASCHSSLKQMETKRTRRKRVPEERASKCSHHTWKCFQKQILTKAMIRHVYCCVNMWDMRNMINIYIKERGRRGFRLLPFCHVRPTEIYVLASCHSSLKQMETKRTRRERAPEERRSKCSLHPWKCFQKQIPRKAMIRHVYCCVNMWDMRNMINIYIYISKREDVEVSGSYPFAMSVQLKSTS